MKNIFLAIAAAASMNASLNTPALAGGIEGVFANQNQVRGGLYIRIPFAGGLKGSHHTDLQYGFNFGVTRTYSPGLWLMENRRRFSADIVQLKFDSFGFDNFAIGGRDVIVYRRNELGLSKNDDGSTNWTPVVVGVLLVGAVVGIALATQGNDEECDSSTNIIPFCGFTF